MHGRLDLEAHAGGGHLAVGRIGTGPDAAPSAPDSCGDRVPRSPRSAAAADAIASGSAAPCASQRHRGSCATVPGAGETTHPRRRASPESRAVPSGRGRPASVPATRRRGSASCKLAVRPDLPLPFRLRADHGLDPASLALGAELVRVVAGVADERSAGGEIEQLGRGDHLVSLARRQRDVERPPFRVDDRVDLGRRTSLRASNSVPLDPPLPPDASALRARRSTSRSSRLYARRCSPVRPALARERWYWLGHLEEIEAACARPWPDLK